MLGGVLAPFDFHLIFIVNIPFAILGAVWSYYKLREEKSPGSKSKMDIIGNVFLSAGLILIALGLTYALMPFGSSSLGWSNPWVLTSIMTGLILLLLFILVEKRVKYPILKLSLFRNLQFSFSSIALFLSSLARGAVMFLVIIWLQGVYLPLHGYSITQTPFWAGIFMVPLVVGFIAFGPISGILTDKFGARLFSTLGLGVIALGLYLLSTFSANFSYVPFAIVLFIIGAGNGLFAAPNTKRTMDALSWKERGVGNGVRTTFSNIGQMMSMVIFFTLAITIFSYTLPGAMSAQMASLGVPHQLALQISHTPASTFLFSAFLGICPTGAFLASMPNSTISLIPLSSLSTLKSCSFIPGVIASPFMQGLRFSLYIGIIILAVAAVLSAFTKHRVAKEAKKHQK